MSLHLIKIAPDPSFRFLASLCLTITLMSAAPVAMAVDGAESTMAPMDTTVELFKNRNSESESSRHRNPVYIVVMKDQPLAHYRGGITGLKGTSRAATGASKVDARSDASIRYLSYLADQRSAAINKAEAAVGRNLDVKFEYGATLVGFAAEMNEQEALAIENLDEVAFVERETISQLHTDAGPQWSLAGPIWGGDWESRSFSAVMNGGQEVPPVVSSASGIASFQYDFVTNTLEYEIEVVNPSGVSLTAMHIHQAPAGVNGPVIFNFEISATTGGLAIADSVVLTGEQEAWLVHGELYVNVHSDANPAGEIRGQILPDGTFGEGIIVGILDTGVDPWNPSFLGTGGDGYMHTNPKGSGVYLGVCDSGDPSYDPTFPCNDKLIGAWGYPGVNSGDPRDPDGHGSHTASTAAGNFVEDATIIAPTGIFMANISGVAPHANIIAYSVCDGGCPGSATNAARDQALLDGVDVINYSIGASAPTGDFWGSSEALQWLALREAGVFVATSAGNSGNGDATLGRPADLPWITSVGANSHDRQYRVTLTLTDETNTTVEIFGQALTTGYDPEPAQPVVLSTIFANTDDARLCAPGTFPPGTFNGEIVVCERGTYGRVAKGQAVLDGGAGGYVLAQPEEEAGGPGAVAADSHALPAVHIDYGEYQKLLQFLQTDAIGEVTGVLSDANPIVAGANGDIMASFSSRGPNGTDADLIVPSVTAPGRAIFAAYKQGDGGDGDFTFNMIQGTSMSSPHVAGAAALLTELHPDWTPAEMQSAIMMNAFNGVSDDDGSTIASPFAQGSGHLITISADRTPLLMNVPIVDYENANPAENSGIGVRDLNTASLGDDNCISVCTWWRTVRNVSGSTQTWSMNFDGPPDLDMSFEPQAFTLAPDETRTIRVDLNVEAAEKDDWQFGTVQFIESIGGAPVAQWPVAVNPQASNIPEVVRIVTQETSRTTDLEDLKSRAIDDMTFNVVGLRKAGRSEFTAIEDNNLSADFPDIFFDPGSPTVFTQIIVPDDSFAVVAEFIETTSPDLDLLLFRDVDDDGPDLEDVGDPDENPDACSSASGGSDERCEIFSPTEGTWYAATLNFDQNLTEGDLVDLATAVIPNGGIDEGNLVVTGPTDVDTGELYDLMLEFNGSGLSAIDKLYGYFSVVTNPGGGNGAGGGGADPEIVAKVLVDLEYLGIPDISIDPTTLETTLLVNSSEKENLTVMATGGLLDWDVTKGGGNEAVQDGSFEEGNTTNPYWRSDASVAAGVLPICSLATCGVDIAADRDWYLWLGGLTPLTSHAEQDVTIAPGVIASLNFNMLMGTNAPGTAEATLVISLDGTTIATFTEDDLIQFNNGYVPVSIDVSAFADGGSYTLRFDFENTSPANFNMFIDEVSLISSPTVEVCKGVGGIPWLDVDPAGGTLSPGQTELMVTFSAVALEAGEYSDLLCIRSNDPDEPTVSLPVIMNVIFDPMIFNDGFEPEEN